MSFSLKNVFNELAKTLGVYKVFEIDYFEVAL